MLDMELLATVQINRLFVDKDQGTWKIDFTDDVRFAGDVNNRKIVAGHGAQADGVGRVGLVGPVIVFSGKMQKTGLSKTRAKIRQIYFPKLFLWRDRQFKRRALQVINKNLQVVRLDERMLGRAAKEIIGMTQHELVERRGRRHQHGAGASAAAAGTSGTLPGGGNRARIACHYHGVERTNINSQFQRAGRDHAADLSITQAALDFTPLVR